MKFETFLNKDNDDLQPLGLPEFCIGLVDSVNGNGARGVPEFIPTRAELLELVKYYEAIFLDSEFFVFRFEQIGSTELRLVPFAERRVTRIIDLLGREAVEAVQKVRDEFAKSLEAREWERFLEYLGPHHVHGTTVDTNV